MAKENVVLKEDAQRFEFRTLNIFFHDIVVLEMI